ncbi:MAG TPA: glycosyltransferase family 2 protein [Polyangiaceae bacterium]|jgi:dolichol-phosphate mannosyltransferase|nr:glycosyltransferase family 2 protein [Polyangiaceae bacterium]
MPARPKLSLVLPIFNEEEIIPELDRRLRAFLSDLPDIGDDWEIVFIDDGSRDKSLSMLEALSAAEPRYKIIALSRNFGHQLAITAGIDRAEGEAVVVMDADLQDPPEVVVEMLERYREGFDIVYAIRKRRHGETLFKRATAALFYRFLRAMLGVTIPLDAGDFRLMSHRVVLTLRGLREHHRFVRGMVAWVGFKSTAVTYDRPARFAGETKYPFRKMLRFAVDGITSFSIVPLRAATWLGLLSGALALSVAAWAVYVRFYVNEVVPGWTTIMIMVALGSSAQLLMTGILGEYVGRIYEEVKRRPLYVVAHETNFEHPDRRAYDSRRVPVIDASSAPVIDATSKDAAPKDAPPPA